MGIRKAVLFILVFGLGFGLFAQDLMTLDDALYEAAEYIEGRLQRGTKVVVFNIDSNRRNLSDYLIEELTINMVDNGQLTVVDRSNLELLQQEMDFQMSGEVSDESAQDIGKKLGAQSIVSGSISAVGEQYRLRLRILEVETAKVQGMQSYNIGMDAVLTSLIGGGRSRGSTAVAQAAPAAAAAPAASSTKPEKRLADRRSFVVIQGRGIQAPIDKDKFYRVAVQAAKDLKFELLDEGTGFLHLKYTRRASVWFAIKLCYWDDEYWFEYEDSAGFSADLGRNRIHDNYRELLADLNNRMRRFYR
jgi:TolB-like protein